MTIAPYTAATTGVRACACTQCRLALTAQVAHGARRVDELTGEVGVDVVLIDEPELDVVLRRT